MQNNHFEKVIEKLVGLCGAESTKADLARRLEPVFPGTRIRLQDINNWRKRGIPVSKCDAIERELGFPKHAMRPDAFSPPADVVT